MIYVPLHNPNFRHEDLVFCLPWIRNGSHSDELVLELFSVPPKFDLIGWDRSMTCILGMYLKSNFKRRK